MNPFSPSTRAAMGTVTTLVCVAFVSPNAFAQRGTKSSGSHSVRSYVKKDGTYVAPHRATNPDKSFDNNWSTKGNVNPYTGEEGTRVTPPTRSYSSGSSYVPLSPPSANPYTGDEGTRGTPLTRSYSSGISGSSYAPISPPSVTAHSVIGYRPTHPYPPVTQGVVSGARSEHTARITFDEYQRQREAESKLYWQKKVEALGESVNTAGMTSYQMSQTVSQIEWANRLQKKGVDVDWRTSTAYDMSDKYSRIGWAERLKSKGITVDWRVHTAYEMSQMYLRLPKVLTY